MSDETKVKLWTGATRYARTCQLHVGLGGDVHLGPPARPGHWRACSHVAEVVLHWVKGGREDRVFACDLCTVMGQRRETFGWGITVVRLTEAGRVGILWAASLDDMRRRRDTADRRPDYAGDLALRQAESRLYCHRLDEPGADPEDPAPVSSAEAARRALEERLERDGWRRLADLDPSGLRATIESFPTLVARHPTARWMGPQGHTAQVASEAWVPAWVLVVGGSLGRFRDTPGAGFERAVGLTSQALALVVFRHAQHHPAWLAATLGMLATLPPDLNREGHMEVWAHLVEGLP